MADTPGVGLSRREMEEIVRWYMRKAPADPKARVDHVVEVVITLLEKNNAAVARALAAREDPTTPGAS